ncbi:MAG: carboxypeptidase regulatory-like domain-containing protein, partial [Planctomycetes bacterium]|nr:carboxypeptidase regulatory-like domain-containing protein [Planctomycetota bacterium]
MRSLLAILFVVLAGLLAARAFGEGIAPPANAPGDGGSAVAGTSAAVEAQPPVRGDAARRAAPTDATARRIDRAPAEIAAPGLFGTALDHLGEPLGGLDVRLLPDGARPHQALWARTDERGAFAFEDVHGTFTCSLWNHVTVSRELTLAPGERREITLQVEQPCVLVTGRVTAGSRPIHDRTVGVHGSDASGEVHHDAHTDEHGRYAHLLRPGRYELMVVGPPTSMSWSMKGSTIWVEVATEAMARAELALAATPTRIEHDFELSSAEVAVRVCSPDDRPIADASVTIRETSGTERSWTRRTDDDGTITFAELPAGEWTLTAVHELHLPPMPRHVVTRARDGRQQ